MKRPGFRTLLLGSRLTAPPILLGSAWYTWQWWEAGGPNNLGLLSIALFVMSAKATAEVAAYRQWRADWRAMSPGGQGNGRKMPWTIPITILGIVLLGAGLAWASSPDAPAQLRDNLAPLAVGCAGLAVVLILCRFIGRAIGNRRPPMIRTVTSAIERPILRACSLRTCYRRLPPYCQQLLGGSRS